MLAPRVVRPGTGVALRAPAEPMAHRAPVSAARPVRPSAPAPREFSQVPVAVGRADDPLEREADQLADDVMRMPGAGSTRALREPIRREGAADDARPTVRAKPLGPARLPENAPPVVSAALRGPGRPLDAVSRDFFEPRFGRDFSQVRVHMGDQAARSARALGAKAYTAGHAIVFGAGAFAPTSPAGQRLIAHELSHVVQQSTGRAPPILQRYEAGEHAAFGETGTELQALLDAPASIYVVKKGGESLSDVAAAAMVSVTDLTARNKAKVKEIPVPAPPGPKPKGKPPTVAGFAGGEKVEIPQVLNAAQKDASGKKELSYETGKADVAGKRAKVTYGEGIAMSADLFGAPKEIQDAEKSKLDSLDKLIDDEKTGRKAGKWVDNAKWTTETGGRFVELAGKNESHFAPSDPALAPATSSATAPNHKSEWERYHGEALGLSQGGEQDKALQVNAFADHFLTDAFSAGHLINKLDVMDKFKATISVVTPDPKKPKEQEVAASSTGFFDEIAKQSFTGPVKTLFSQYETVAYKGLGVFRPNIDRVERFSKLLQQVYLDPTGMEYVLGGVAKGVHDDLNTRSGGVPVENAMGDKWGLSGDKTLNDKTLEVGRKAVAQSQFNVLDVFNKIGPPDLKKLFKAVWDYVPHPTAAGAKDVKGAVDQGADSAQPVVVSRLAKLVVAEHPTILAQLVTLGFLKKA